MRGRVAAMVGFAVLGALVGAAWWRARPVGPPAGPSNVPAVARLASDVDVVLIGDSLTAGGNWPRRLPGVAVANRGVAGDGVADVSARMDGILATRPEIAFVMVGVNDAGRGRGADEILADYVDVVDALQRAGVDVVIQSTIECSRSTCGGAVLQVIRDLNRELETLAAERGLDYLELNRSLSDSAGLKAIYTHDGIHLDEDGYRLWADALREHLDGKSPRPAATGGGSSVP